MKTIEKIRLLIRQTKEQGHDAISINAFESYLSSIESENEEYTKYAQMQLERDLAVFKAENDRNIAHANNLTTNSLELFRSVILSGQSALKASMVINGGAAVALLAFMGKIWGSSIASEVAYSLSRSTFLFCVGIVLGAFAAGTTYFTQCLYNIEKFRLGNFFNIATVLMILSSYGIFIFSAFISASSFGVHFGL
ncbi:hypothetical protein FKN93_17950 [Vibrio sp. A8-1]|uniref:hypothetical protein n=1 Tax=Vibrio sp. A8-1 TaxID=2591023 RepID=UPI0014826927|nr:hypothetical protein [Vibrio sp. A8-1]NNN85795.1 hypothetical protein [Vibrio sp. A8-1]